MDNINLVDYAKEELKNYVNIVNKSLDKYRIHETNRIIDNDLFKQNDIVKKYAKVFIDHINEHNTRPAKRLRASLIYYTYKLFFDDIDDETLNKLVYASMSIELVHTGLLIHDDYQDQDSIRRWLPTTHKYFEQYAYDNLDPTDAQHFGASVCINGWDTWLTLGYQILLNCWFDYRLTSKAMNILFDGIVQTAFGQNYDIILENKNNVNCDDVIALHNGKTGIYTYQTPMMIWMILADKFDNNFQRLLSDYAINCGIAFQIQDDILWVFGDEEKTWKSSYSDIKEWKKTLLSIKLMEFAKESDLPKIQKSFGNHDINQEDVSFVRQYIKDCGSLAYSYAQAKYYSDIAVSNIQKIRQSYPELNNDSLNFLEWVALYMWMERDR